MISLMYDGGRLSLNALALVLGIWGFSGPAAMAVGGESAGTDQFQEGGKPGIVHHGHRARGYGTLGYGGPGLHPGFQGFGLGYHLGYGYGGDALGVGAGGGYPFYGGPGYPHAEPRLRRFGGGIVPFPYYGGPGYPSPGHPNYFGGVGPLVVDQPVVTIGTDRGDPGYASGYGPFTGAIPYPDTLFGSFTATTSRGGSLTSVSPSDPLTTPASADPDSRFGQPPASIPPNRGAIPDLSARRRTLGIDAEPVVDSRGMRGIKVSTVYPGTAAEKAGLHSGDVILSINGYITEQPANLAWIIANAEPTNVLKMNVRTAADGRVRTNTAQLP